MKKNPVKSVTVVPEIVETWKGDNLNPAIISWKSPSPSLNSVGKILFYHRLAMESGKVSIAAALMTALELYKVKMEHPKDFIAWCDSNLRDGNLAFRYKTADRYLKALNKSVGRSTDLYSLANDTQDAKLEAVANYTKYTNYQSLYELYKGEGIVAKSKLGGDRPGAGRKRKDAKEELAAAAKKLAAETGAQQISAMIGDLFVECVSQDGFGNLKTEDLRMQLESLRKILKRGEEILKSRRGK